jgi:SAM-dependent methyltransferase
MARVFDWIGWRWARFELRAEASRFPRGLTGFANRRFREATRTKPQCAPYERLAELYVRYSQDLCPRYDDYLQGISRWYAFPIRDVLDLACGAGTLTARLASRFKTVLGLDVNDSMLQCAQQVCAEYANVRLVKADFHAFALAERFDAVLCASDSLNYVARPEDLEIVFRQVAAHLRPGGFFLFDVLDRHTMRHSAQFDIHYQENGTRFAMYSEYDEILGRDITRVVFADCVEEHVRVPLEQQHIQSAAVSSGLDILDRFRDFNGFRSFYVLRQPEQIV